MHRAGLLRVSLPRRAALGLGSLVSQHLARLLTSSRHRAAQTLVSTEWHKVGHRQTNITLVARSITQLLALALPLAFMVCSRVAFKARSCKALYRPAPGSLVALQWANTVLRAAAQQ